MPLQTESMTFCPIATTGPPAFPPVACTMTLPIGIVACTVASFFIASTMHFTTLYVYWLIMLALPSGFGSVGIPICLLFFIISDAILYAESPGLAKEVHFSSNGGNMFAGVLADSIALVIVLTKLDIVILIIILAF
jgi:hypothetical protein